MSVISQIFRMIRRSCVLRFACLGAVIPNAAPADSIVLDFEGLSGMTYLTGNPIPESSRLSDQWLSTFGVTFDSGGGYVAVVNLGSVYAISGINGIGGSTPADILTYDRSFPILASFFDPASPGVPATTDFVSLRIDRLGDSGLSVTLEAFDLGGVLLDSFTTADISGATLQVSVPGIHSVRFLGTNDIGGAGVDDFAFNAVTPVPEPASATTLALGLALLGVGRGRSLAGSRSPRPSGRGRSAQNHLTFHGWVSW